MAHEWNNRVQELPSPPFVKKEQHENIKKTCDEIQEFAITNVKCDDGSVKVTVKEGEAIISAADTGQGDNVTLQLCQKVSFSAPTLTYTPVTLEIDPKGRIVGIVVGSVVTIDTAEACDA